MTKIAADKITIDDGGTGNFDTSSGIAANLSQIDYNTATI